MNNGNKSFSFFPPSFRSYGNNLSRIETNYDKESVFESVIKQSLRTIQITGGASATNSITLVDYWKVVAFLSLLPPNSYGAAKNSQFKKPCLEDHYFHPSIEEVSNENVSMVSTVIK